MRMHPAGSLIEIRVLADILDGSTRVKDRTGSWAPCAKVHARKGRASLVYLNRFEGVVAGRAIDLSTHDPHDLESMSDRAFQRLVPEAADSWLLLDPEIATVANVLSGADCRPRRRTAN
jgi:hypothetical protein